MTSRATDGAKSDWESSSSTPRLVSAPLRHGRPLAREGRYAPTPPSYLETAAHWNDSAAPIVRALFDALNEERVRYCHWKSNIRLGETLAGDQDIDLLVDRLDLARLQVIMAQLGFKTTVARAGLGHPGVFHALALDERSGRLVDLHVYHGTLSGDSLVKSFRFPLRELLLDQATTVAGIVIPAPEAELLTFVVRIALKHTSPIEILKINRKYRKNVAELAWLQQAADPMEVERLLPEVFPRVDIGLYRDLLDAVASPRALPRRIVLGWRLARRLDNLRRVGPLTALASRTWRLLSWLRNRALKRGDLCFSGGGAIVAVVGPKGTGKSTLSHRIAAELGRHLVVRHIHAGKPPATLLSAGPRLFLPLARRLLPQERLSEYEKAERRERQCYSLFHVARMTLLAYDRSRLLRRAFRAAANGAVVISDRFPSPTQGAIDSRAFSDAALERTRSPVKHLLMRWERALYRDMPRPDVVLRLAAPMEVALSRDATRNKAGGPDPAAILRRWDLESSGDFPNSQVIEVDTAGDLQETVRRAVKAAWSGLR